jgi:SAM-dependent methyltransferase
MPVVHPSRACPVCLGAAKSRLFRQRFASLSAGSLIEGFDLVVCDKCGAAFADDIPEQAVFDRYYAEMSKYEYASGNGTPTPSDLARFSEIADLVAPHLKASESLIDIGCATGGLLAEFKTRGFTHLLGVDPSPACARLTTHLHGITARALTIGRLAELGERFDAAFLTGVLEHVRDVDDSLKLIGGALAPEGHLYIEVPDASRYHDHFSAPYQLLSMEHINYFSPTSLTALLSRHGYAPVLVKRVLRQLSPQAIEPCVGGLFRRTTAPIPVPQPDYETRQTLALYLEQSAVIEHRIHARIDALVDAAVPLAVWGTGTHTLRLLETSRLSTANIVAFIDSNINYQGKSLIGHPILSPKEFTGNPADILISSHVAEVAIQSLIVESLRWPNRIHLLYR